MKLATLSIFLTIFVLITFTTCKRTDTKSKDVLVTYNAIAPVVPFVPYVPYTSLYYPYYLTGYIYSYDYDWAYSSTLVLVGRKEAGKTEKKAAPSLAEVKKELKALKKNVFGSENFNTDKIRAEKAAFDADWLAKQAKITRALQLEDYLKNRKAEEDTDQADEAPSKDMAAKMAEAAAVPATPKEAAPAKTRKVARKDDEEEEQDDKDKEENRAFAGLKTEIKKDANKEEKKDDKKAKDPVKTDGLLRKK